MKFPAYVVCVLALPLALCLTAGCSAAPDPLIQQDKERLLQTRACPGCNLSGLTLNRADLKGVNLEGANLSGAKLFLADLSGANLRHTDLRNASLGGADLSRADMEGADLDGAVLDGAFFDAEYKAPAAAAAQAQSKNFDVRHFTRLAVPKANAPALPASQVKAPMIRRDFVKPSPFRPKKAVSAAPPAKAAPRPSAAPDTVQNTKTGTRPVAHIAMPR